MYSAPHYIKGGTAISSLQSSVKLFCTANVKALFIQRYLYK